MLKMPRIANMIRANDYNIKHYYYISQINDVTFKFDTLVEHPQWQSK